MCRQYILTTAENRPLIIDAADEATVSLKSLQRNDNQILIYSVSALPEHKYDVNYIKMSPRCIVNNKR